MLLFFRISTESKKNIMVEKEWTDKFSYHQAIVKRGVTISSVAKLEKLISRSEDFFDREGISIPFFEGELFLCRILIRSFVSIIQTPPSWRGHMNEKARLFLHHVSLSRSF